MKQNIFLFKRLLSKLFTLGLMLSALASCKKSDHFFTKLQSLPQVDYSTSNAYKSAYTVGDTMCITGRLQPQNGLKITIGGVKATIVKADTIPYNLPGGLEAGNSHLERAYLLITDKMVGKAQEVKITTGGYSITGAAVDIYPAVEPGSFSKSLKAVAVKPFADPNNTFLFCQNGKGDVYYYAAATKDLRHIKKGGSEEILYDLSESLDTGSQVLVTSFLAGGINPQGTKLYFSVSTSQGYRLYMLDLGSKELNLLNQSTGLAEPYEGQIDKINLLVTGIYPDSAGNLYLAIGLGNGKLLTNDGSVFLPDALARYNLAENKVSYIYKNFYRSSTSGRLPGAYITNVTISYSITGFAISPDENLLYLLGQNTGTFNKTIEVFDLDVSTKLVAFNTGNSTNGLTQLDVIGPFSKLQLNMGVGTPYAAEAAFGYLPMPGKRLQILLYQYLQINSVGTGNIPPQYGFPRWITFDFDQQRSYAYAPGRFNSGGYVFGLTRNTQPVATKEDRLLNYDEEGNLYMTANGKSVLIKTQTAN